MQKHQKKRKDFVSYFIIIRVIFRGLELKYNELLKYTEKDLAMALWDMVLSDKFMYYEQWKEFLVCYINLKIPFLKDNIYIQLLLF